MSILLLVIIYIVFISLGLPDSLIGSSWPSISNTLEISASLQGVVTFIISIMTIISSFATNFLIRKLKEKGVVALSILLTVLGLVGFSLSNNFYLFCFSAVPLGLGAGAIDTTLNNYVAIRYKAIHLNWLHAFWGVGATISPLISGGFIASSSDGYKIAALILALIQGTILLIVLLSFPIWNKVNFNLDSKESNSEIKEIRLNLIKTFKIRGVLVAAIGFFAYIAVEQTCGLWFSSMITYGFNMDEEIGTHWTTLFYLGMMIGRFISGVISLKIKDKNMIRIGEGLIFIGIILMTFKFNVYIMPVSLVLIGLGCAPVYPGIIHATPNRFSKELSASVMSVQVGCAYIANITAAPLFGIIGNNLSFLLLPYYVLVFFIVLTICNEVVLKLTKDKSKLLSRLKVN